jgi:endonuclease/exonuclease/phosphatase family metal-dependent hydrolase
VTLLMILAGTFPGFAGDEPATAAPVVVLSFNIRTSLADPRDAKLGNDWARRKPLALKVLKELDPDVVGLQEATDGQVRDLREGYQVFQMVELAFLHRADRLEALEGGYLTLGAFGHPDPWGDRWALWQRFRPRKGGAAFVVVMTHLSTAKDNQPQAVRTLDLAADQGRDRTPVVVMGDFNFDAAPMLAGRGFRDALSDTRGTFHAFKGGREGERIDFIGVRGFKVLGEGVYTRAETGGPLTVYPSDHYPIWARVVAGK